ncbi:MAG: alpha/beta fold hydrolase [Actinomycetales bacterium]|jgi:pimeloyl-ACP methyl ester carboxylesterase|nr:alpha/beta fold hydrolase [Actinomycetales bacterium]
MTTDGMLALHTLRRGIPGSLPLVLLHAFPVDHRMWWDVTDLLPGERTVLAPDLPGFGSSPSGPDVAVALGADRDVPSIDVMGDGVAATLRAAGVERAAVAGLSMGGYVALSMAERHPDLVAGLGLVDTKATADDDEARARREEIAQRVLAEQRVEAVYGMRTALLGATDRVERPDLVERLAGWIADQGPHAIAWAQRAMAARPDRTEVLSRFTGPALVVVGEEDEQSPVDVARAMSYLLPDSDLVIVPRAGHMTSIESPQPVASGLSRLVRRAEAALAGRDRPVA